MIQHAIAHYQASLVEFMISYAAGFTRFSSIKLNQFFSQAGRINAAKPFCDDTSPKTALKFYLNFLAEVNACAIRLAKSCDMPKSLLIFMLNAQIFIACNTINGCARFQNRGLYKVGVKSF